MTDFATQANLLFGYIPAGIRDVFVSAWTTYGGDTNLAMAQVRQDPNYEHYFPGNKRPDGTVFLDEGSYLSNIEAYNRVLTQVGVDPAEFAATIPELIAQDKSPSEFASEITQVLLAGPSVRQAFAEQHGVQNADFSDAALVASWFDGEGGRSPQEFDRQFQIAQMQGAATNAGFDFGRGQAERYAQLGVSAADFTNVANSARSELPQLNDLLARHNDPKDEFSLADYGDAILLKDPADLQAISRAITGEKSGFSAQHLLGQDQGGGVAAGLMQR